MNIIRELQSRNCKITALPSTAGVSEIMALRPDTLLLSNGPGDPQPLDGPEMRSTGEAIGTGAGFGEAFAKIQAAVNGIRHLITGEVTVNPLPEKIIFDVRA